MRSMRRSSARQSGTGKTTRCEDLTDIHRPSRRGAVFYSRLDNTGSAIFQPRSFRYNAGPVMSNIPVAFLVLGAFFTLYFVAALWRSRPK
jgi:hypothetical protein